MTFKIRDLFNFEGKVALVTGGSSGIGKMIATVFAANGMRVYIVGRKRDRLEAAVAEIGLHGTCVPLMADLSKQSDIETLAEEMARKEPQLSVLVNNAGATWAAPIETFPQDGWDRVFTLNVRSVFFLTQRLLPLLAASATEADWARVINLSSVGARVVGDGTSVAYSASKAAVEQLTRVLARTLAPHRVTVNCISPGWFPSRMNAPIRERDGDAWLAETPLRRFGMAEDIGGLALYFASRAGIYVNGQTVVIDGGRTV